MGSQVDHVGHHQCNSSQLTVGLGESSRLQAMTDYLYKSTKLITETEIGTFVTQFINCKKGVSARASE